MPAPLHVTACDWGVIEGELRALEKQCRYEEALDAVQGAIALAETQFGSAHSMVARMLVWFAWQCRRLIRRRRATRENSLRAEC